MDEFDIIKRFFAPLAGEGAFSLQDDVALLPQTRGLGLGVGITARLVRQAVAAGVPWLSLIAVGGSLRFWEKNGFGVADQVAVRESLATYGETAVFMTRPVSQADC